MPIPEGGERIMALARLAGAAARQMYGDHVKTLVVVYPESDPSVQSHAGTDSDLERVKAALRKTLADLEGMSAPMAWVPAGTPISGARTAH